MRWFQGDEFVEPVDMLDDGRFVSVEEIATDDVFWIRSSMRFEPGANVADWLLGMVRRKAASTQG